MSAEYPHEEQAAYCGCMDGRTALTQSMLSQLDGVSSKHGQAFRFFWGGGPLLFLLPDWRKFAEEQFRLGYKVNPFTDFYGDLHMSCGAYAALAGRTFASRDEEIQSKREDIAAIKDVISSFGLPVRLHLGIIDVDGTRLVDSPDHSLQNA